MHLSTEAILMLVLAGLYLYDCGMLVYANEGILSPARRSWKVRLGSENFGIGGRELLVLPPLLPHRAAFRLSWQIENTVESREGQPDLDAFHVGSLEVFHVLALFGWSIAFGLFVLLPLGFFSMIGEAALMSALILVYGNIICGLVFIWFKRASLKLPTRKFLLVAFEWFACPPFAINMVRHLSLRLPFSADLALTARQLQSEQDWQMTRKQFLLRIDEEIEQEDPESERISRLRSRRDQIIEEVSCQA